MISNPSTSFQRTDDSLAQSPASFPSLFCEPKSRDFGQRYFGQRGFGGLIEDCLCQNHEDSTRWIPQYNLKHFWRRDVPPFSSGLIEPLIPPRIKTANDFHRLPGHLPFRTNEYELYNRNLLATRYFDKSETASNPSYLKIWTVNERSKRRLLECFSVEIGSNGIPLVESVETTSKYKLNMMPPVKNETRLPKTKEPLLELKASIWSSDALTRLFLRSPTLLQMVHLPEGNSQDEVDTIVGNIPIFHSAVKSFAESHHLEGGLAVVDYGGRVWIHDILSESADKPEKLAANEQEIYQFVTFCDHPKMIAVAGNFHVETVDMRSAGRSRACTELWRSPIFETRGRHEAMYVQGVPPASAVVRHISRIPGTSNNYLVMTDRALHLIDDRFPGKTVLSVEHPFSSGSHKMIVSDRVKDVASGGNVFSLFSLDQFQVLNSSVSMTKLYLHPSGIWSSVDAFHSIGEPENFKRTIYRGKYAEPGFISEPTRAMSLVEHEGLNSSLLLRQTDDGSIWWQKFSKENVSIKQGAEEEKKGFKRINERRNESTWKREDHRPVYSDKLAQELKETPNDMRQVISVGSSSVDSRVISKFYHRAVNLQRQSNRFIVTNPYNQLEVFPLDDVNSVLSKITLDTWAAAEKMMNENSS